MVYLPIDLAVSDCNTGTETEPIRRAFHKTSNQLKAIKSLRHRRMVNTNFFVKLLLIIDIMFVCFVRSFQHTHYQVSLRLVQTCVKCSR